MVLKAYNCIVVYNLFMDRLGDALGIPFENKTAQEIQDILQEEQKNDKKNPNDNNGNNPFRFAINEE